MKIFSLFFIIFLNLNFKIINSIKYPSEIIETPIVICEVDRIIIKVKTSSSNPSQIYVDGKEYQVECGTRNQNKIEIEHNKCGMINEIMETPKGNAKRICITVQLHPLFVTEADRSYCAQCIYSDTHIMRDIESTLDISQAPPTHLSPQFDLPIIPKCSYKIRKQSTNGPQIQYASIGDSVFHVWDCEGENNGILVQNCHVEDGQGNKILIIDQNGCGIDQYVMATPIYNSDQSMAYQETHVFKFAQRTITRFICQIRICLKGDDCRRLSPPNACPTLEERLTINDQNVESNNAQTEVNYEPPSFPNITNSDSDGEEDVSVEFARRSPTKGSIYYGIGYNPKRHRREILINQTPKTEKQFVMRNGYPEMEMVGELRVFENPQDVEYFESQNSFQQSSECGSSAMSTLFFTLLVTSLIVFSILLISLFLLISSRIRSKKNNSMHYAQ